MPIEELDEKRTPLLKSAPFLSSPENPQTIFPGILLLFCFPLKSTIFNKI